MFVFKKKATMFKEDIGSNIMWVYCVQCKKCQREANLGVGFLLSSSVCSSCYPKYLTSFVLSYTHIELTPSTTIMNQKLNPRDEYFCK